MDLAAGDRVHAKWRGNGCWYLAVVKNVEKNQNRVTLDWDDGDTSDRVVDFKDVCKVADESRPSRWEQIDDATLVKDLPGKGRCLFTRNYVKSGSVLFIERPTLVAVPSKHPDLWNALKTANSKDPFSLGTISFHYAAILSYFTLPDADVQVILDKFVPEGENEETSGDVIRILELIPTVQNLQAFANRPPLTGKILQNLVNAWRCGCTRCILQIDLARGFRCLKCRSGAHYYVENSPSQQLTACDVCAELCRDSEREQCLQLEPEYVQRIESLDRSNGQDLELVYNAALDFFHDNHWCVFACDQMLWEYYREKDSEVQYHARVYPRPTFVWAWGLEELADNLQKQISGGYDKLAGVVPGGASKTKVLKGGKNSCSRLAEIINMYRKAQCQLSILCGPGHPYTIAPQNKWHAAQQTFTTLMN
eukprot:g1433.t1